MPDHPCTVKVSSASTTPQKGGDVLLRVCTDAGPGQLLFPAPLARQLLVITNRTSVPADVPTGKPRAVLTPERVALYERIEREIESDPSAYGALSRACARAGVNCGTFASWRNKRAARARAAATRAPIAKPSGSLL